MAGLRNCTIFMWTSLGPESSPRRRRDAGSFPAQICSNNRSWIWVMTVVLNHHPGTRQCMVNDADLAARAGFEIKGASTGQRGLSDDQSAGCQAKMRSRTFAHLY